LFDPAFNIPHIPTLTLLKIIESSQILIGNDYEIELIRRRLGATVNDLTNLVKYIVITYGSKGSKILTKGKTISIKPAKPKNISDPTGAGDCYRAGFLAGYVKKLPIKVCAQMGSVASVYTVEKYGTQTHKFSLGEFSKRFKDNFKSTLTGLTAE
jgi:adenosine kinase